MSEETRTGGQLEDAAGVGAAREEGARSGWRPIETAPRDGSVVDLWLGRARQPDCYFGRPYHTCGEAGRYCDSCPPDEDVWCDEFGPIGDTPPTHWMPLPPPPEAQRSEPAQRQPSTQDAPQIPEPKQGDAA